MIHKINRIDACKLCSYAQYNCTKSQSIVIFKYGFDSELRKHAYVFSQKIINDLNLLTQYILCYRQSFERFKSRLDKQ